MRESDNNAILVRETEGRATVEYCKADEGEKILDQALANGSGGTLFTFEDGAFEAEFYMKYSNIKARVDDAVAKLNNDLKMRDALDAAGVPKDVELRKKVYQAMKAYAEQRFDAVVKAGKL